MDFDSVKDLFSHWPEVPQEEQEKGLRDFPVNYYIPEDLSATLAEKGWRVQDVRLLGTTDAGRAEAVKLTLEGIRLGTIEFNEQIHKSMELEAKIYGLVGSTKKLSNKQPGVLEGSFDYVLQLDETFKPKLPQKRKRGRKRKLA